MAGSMAARMSGIDVSHFQGEIDWFEVRSAGICFAFIKATEGAGMSDPLFGQNWRGAKRAGVLRGAYHFCRPEVNAEVQAQFFLQKLQDDAGELPPVLDLEVLTNCEPEQVIHNAQTWLQIVEDKLATRPILYTGSSFWRKTLKNSTAFSGYPLWIAHYTNGPKPLLPSAWPNWTFWQFAQAGRVAGIQGEVDLDIFNGDAADLEAFCVPGTTNVKDGVPA
jgi:lysozyme